MNTGLSDLLGVALPALTLGLLVLVGMVQLELGPFSRLAGEGKWLLTGAFGMGLLAFSLKIGVAIAVAKAPEWSVAPFVAAHPKHQLQDDSGAGRIVNPAAPLAARVVWQALPAQAPAPADNPTTPAKVALGKRLFFEKRLSADGTLSCASCHDLSGKAGGDGRPTARGVRGQVGSRNAPTVWNAAFQSVLFWDGRASSLEEQAKGPILNPVEMGLASAAEAERRLAAAAGYRADFAEAFGDETVTFDRIAKAIAAFERTLITPDAPYDRFVQGDVGALSPAQLRGMALFESLGCVTCHQGPAFSDASVLGGRLPLRMFPANASPYEAKYALLADGGARGKSGLRGMWRIPSLRNVALTGPWLHNGSVKDLAEVVRIMAAAQLGASISGGSGPAGRVLYWSADSRELGRVERRMLSDSDVNDIVAFLEALSSDSLATPPGGRHAAAAATRLPRPGASRPGSSS